LTDEGEFKKRLVK